MAGAAILLIVIASYVGVGAVFCSATLHVPRRVGHVPPGAERAEVMASDRAQLVAWWFPSRAWNGGCVIVLHGIADSRASSSGFAPMFLNAGYSVLTPDSRAHGESGGEFVTYGLLEKYDVVAWAHWVRKQGCRKVYGLGESLGASILIQAGGVEPCFNAIVAECAYADVRVMAEYRVQHMLPRWLLAVPVSAVVVNAGMQYARLVYRLDFGQVLPMHSIELSSTPVLLIHGLDDDRTPPEQSRELAAVHPARDRLWLVPRAGHTNASTVAAAEFRRRVLGWFAAN